MTFFWNSDFIFCIGEMCCLRSFGFSGVCSLRALFVDPTKAVRIALENAVSVASVLLLTEATITEIPEVNKEPSPEPEMAM